jgi:hypothetical protein
MDIRIFIDCNYSDCVPLVCAYMLLSSVGISVDEDEVSECFESTGEMLANAMRSACSCGCPVKDLGVLVTLEVGAESCTCSMQSLCADCLPKIALNYKVVILGDFVSRCFGPERSLHH